ncbi:MAG: hypothetical protein DRN57_08385, partial [Thermoplasmata archaeon]
MEKDRRVTLRTGWVEEAEEKSTVRQSRTSPSSGPVCPSCGVPLKNIRNGRGYCWFCEREYEISRSMMVDRPSGRDEREEEILGRPAGEFEEDDMVDDRTSTEDFEINIDEEDTELEFEEEEETEEEKEEKTKEEGKKMEL